MERTIKQRTKKPKLFRWALWWGLGIIAVCLTIIIIKDESLEGFEDTMMNAIYSMVYRFGILPVVLYIGIIGPVMEEFVFRLWGNGKLDRYNINNSDGFVCSCCWMVVVIINHSLRSLYTHLFP